MNTKQIVKLLLTLFSVLLVCFYATAFYLRYTNNPLAFQYAWTFSVIFVFLPLEASIAHFAKKANMKVCKLFFLFTFCLHLVVVIGAISIQLVTLIH